MIKFKWTKGNDNIEPIIKLRYDVFCKEQGYPYMLEKDELESVSYHLGVYSGTELIGCGRIAPESDESFHLGRIALYPKYRGNGNGTGLVNELLRKSKELGAKYVTLDAQEHATGFYEKLGFVKDGVRHTDENIPHIPMVKSFVFDNAKLCECGSNEGAVFVRREFKAKSEKIKKATLEYTTLGFSVPYLNSNKLTEYKFIPAWSNYKNRDMSKAIYPIFDEMRERVYYLEYDITDYIRDENTFVLHIGNGWYRQLDQAVEGLDAYGSQLKYIFKIKLFYDDNTVCEINSDASEDVYDSFITHSSIYINETVDGRLFDKNIFNFGYKNEKRYFPSLSDKPTFALKKQDFAGDIKKETVTPELIYQNSDIKIYDLKKDISGVSNVIFDNNAKSGDKITLEYAECIDDGFNLKLRHTGGENRVQKDVFIYGENDCEFTNFFTWRAGQFVKLTGNGKLASFTCVSSAVNKTSGFVSSDEDINWFCNAYIRTQVNNIHSFVPSDCPHRERLGYTGDGQLCSRAVMTQFDARDLYKKWAQDISDCQDAYNGHVQHTAPFYGGGGGPGGWGCAIIAVPYNYYKIYGDKSLCEKYFDNMTLYLDYMESHSESGLVIREEKGGWCLGDWCAPDNKNYLPEPFVNTYFYIKSLNEYIELSYLLKKPRYRQTMSERLEKSLKAFKNAYYSYTTHSFCGGIQGADAFAYDIGLADEECVKNIINKYEKLGEFDTGIFGTDVVIKTLFETGGGTTAVKLLTSKGENSFYNMKKNGATTLWENWDGCDSHSHPMFGAISEYLFTYLLGIKQTEDSAGFEKITINPVYVRDLNVKGYIETVRGKITVEVTYEDSKQNVKYTVPDSVKIIST